MRKFPSLVLISLTSISTWLAPYVVRGDDSIRGDRSMEAAAIVLRNAGSSQAQKIEAFQALERLGPAASGARMDVIGAAGRSGPLHDAAVKAFRAIDPDGVTDLVKILKSGTGADANIAADFLSEMGESAVPVLETLQAMLFSSDAGVCYRAFNIIEALGPLARSTEPSLRQLQLAGGREIRAAAYNALVSVIRDKDAGSHLLYEANKATRAAVAVGVGQDDRAKAEEAANHADADAQLLSSLAETSSVAALREFLRSGDWAVRQWAAKAIEKRGQFAKPALPDLYVLLKDHNSEVRMAAVRAIDAVDPRADKHVLGPTSDLLAHQPAKWPPALRALAAAAEQGADVSEAIGVVGDRLIERSPEVRELAAKVLAKAGVRGDDKAILQMREAYARVLRADDPKIKSFARLVVLTALLRLDPAGEADIGELRAPLNDDSTGDAYAQIIASSGPTSAKLAPKLVDLVAFSQGALRKRALRSLAGIASPAVTDQSTLELLTRLLSEKDNDIRALAAEALGKIGPAANDSAGAVSRLLDSERDSDVAVAARALAGFGSDTASTLPQISALLRSRMAVQYERLKAAPSSTDDPSADVRAACAEALGRLAPMSDQATDLLLLAVTRKDWVVRERLAPAIGLAKEKPAHLLANLNALADRSPDELVRTNARCALRELGVELAAGAR